MDIKGKFQADVTKITMKADTKNDGQFVDVDTEIKVESDKALELFGEDFDQIAFGDMRDVIEKSEEGDAKVTRFGYSRKKMPGWARMSNHKVNLWGNKQNIQPQILNVVAGDNEKSVKLQIRFRYSSNQDAKLIGALGVGCGRTMAIYLEPIQQSLPFARTKDDKTKPLKTKKKTPAKDAVKSTAQKRAGLSVVGATA